MADDVGIYRRPGSVFWWCRYPGPPGEGEQRESTQTKDKRTALAYRRDRVREVAAGTWAPHRDRRLTARTVRDFAREFIRHREESGVRTWRDEKTRLETYVLPRIGRYPLESVRRKHIADMLAEVARAPGTKTEKLSARSVLHVYGVTRLLFDEAVARELIAATPCTLRTKRGELPVKRDKDPRWRTLSRYTPPELVALISDQRIALMRRAFYGTLLLAGLRSGEAIGLHVRDYDSTMQPLGRLIVATQYDERETKTGTTRLVPVHPALAKLLEEWTATGFAEVHGRAPQPDDYLIPSPLGPRRHMSKKTLEWLKDDLDRLELRKEGRGRHAMRHTFISLAQAGGASRDVLETITHEGSDRRAIAGYTVYPWATLCEAVLALKTE